MYDDDDDDDDFCDDALYKFTFTFTFQVKYAKNSDLCIRLI